MKHRVAHDLEPETARQACDAALNAYGRRFPEFSPRATWSTDEYAEIVFSAKGVSLKGTLELVPGAVLLDLEVPFIFRLLKKRAIDVIEGEIRTWVEQARQGKL